jgi:flavin-dependent dehydrogenase
MSVKPSHGVDALYAPHPDVLGPALVRAAVDAGATVRDDISVTGLVADDGRIVGVRGTTADGAAIAVGAKLVIGADGLDSIVADHVDATPSRVGRHAAAMTYGYWSRLDVEGFEFVYRPRACSGFIPTSGGRVCVFASAPPERIGQGGVDVITEIVREGAPELARGLHGAEPPDVTPLWSGRAGFIRRAQGAGWALVGDAGCYQDPVTAHALTDALRDAELLARAVIDGSADDTSMDAALEQYESTRDWLSIHRFDVIDRIASHEWDSPEMAALQLQLSSAMSNEIEVLAALEQ